MQGNSTAKKPYPPVARSVAFCRAASLNLAIVALLLAGATYFASQYFPDLTKVWGYSAMALSICSIGGHVYIAKLAHLDATLGKRRDDPLPWAWWVQPHIALLLALASLGAALVIVDV